MRCHTCGYRLWNLTERRCPECGTPFWPSQYEFVPYSVQFRCPHCRQTYFGHDQRGHLLPARFDCIKCGQPAQMDTMVLLPAESVEEEQTRQTHMPWLERHKRGWGRAWLATIGMALVSPIRLMRELPPGSPSGPAWWFALSTVFLVGAVLLASVAAFQIVMLMFAGISGGPAMLLGFAVFALVGTAMTLLAMFLWGLTAHGLLRLTGATEGGLSRTCQAICYSSGANVISATPCIGLYFGWIWWVISAVLMIKEAQRVSGGRAALAGLLLPVMAVVSFSGLYAAMIFLVMSRTNTAGTTWETQYVTTAVRSFARQNNGRGPEHACELVIGDHLSSSNLVSSDSATLEEQVPTGNTTLDRLFLLPPAQAQAVAKAAREGLPPGTIAHRLGDFVFTYHGLDLTTADPGLWIVIAWPDPDVSPRPPPTNVTVGLADGSTAQRPADQFPAWLAGQNALRANYDLAPLPSPSLVTHAQPATDER